MRHCCLAVHKHMREPAVRTAAGHLCDEIVLQAPHFVSELGNGPDIMC